MIIGNLKFMDVDENSFIYKDFKKLSSLAIYDEQSIESLEYLLQNLDLIKKDALEITANKTNEEIVSLLEKNDFYPNYDWFIFKIKNENIENNSHIQEVYNRNLVKDLLIEQEHELARRMPDSFDINGEEDGWVDCGDVCIAYYLNDEIVSVLTYTIENESNIHIYLTYTKQEYRSKGIGSQMINQVKKIGMQQHIKTLTICTDITEKNRVPNMFRKNGFEYFKTGYDKIIKK